MRAEEESVDTLHRYIGRLSIGRVTIDSHPIINQLKILLFFLVRCINTFVIVLGATQILQKHLIFIHSVKKHHPHVL